VVDWVGVWEASHNTNQFDRVIDRVID